MVYFFSLIGFILLIVDLRETSKRAAELDDQNDTLRGALDYFERLYDQDPQEASAWLHNWTYGDDAAIEELSLWMEKSNG